MGDGQLLPVLRCFSNVWFGILERSVGWIFFFFSFIPSKTYLLLPGTWRSGNALRIGATFGVESSEFGNTNAQVLDTHLAISHF